MISGFVKLPSRPWSQMAKPEKVEAYDALQRSLKEYADGIVKDINELLEAAGAPLRIVASFNITVLDNRDDPRLP